MSGQAEQALQDIEVDIENLYREEVITDLKVASIRKQVPIKIDGTEDTTRKVMFSAQTHIMTPNGPMPLQAELDAENLDDAIKAFPAAMQKALDKMIQEVQEMQREQASRIVVPDGKQGGSIQLP